MPEDGNKPHTSPLFRPHRLIPAEAAVPKPHATPALPARQEMVPWPEAPDVVGSLMAAEAARGLAQQAWLVIEQTATTLEALPAALEARGAPEEAARALEVMRVILLALPNRLAAGDEASVARSDALFAWLINAPGRAGLIQQVLDALTLPDTGLGRSEASTRYAALQEMLRRLHRDLVTLQQQWDEWVSARFPLETFSPQSEPVDSRKAVHHARDSR